MDQTVTVEHLTPGRYYFICSVAGHCSAGMKVKVGMKYIHTYIHTQLFSNVSCILKLLFVICVL